MAANSASDACIGTLPPRTASSAKSWTCPTLVSAEATAERVSWPISLTDIGDAFDELLALPEGVGGARTSSWFIGEGDLKNRNNDSCILCFFG
jgi:hypothetical protein